MKPTRATREMASELAGGGIEMDRELYVGAKERGKATWDDGLSALVIHFTFACQAK